MKTAPLSLRALVAVAIVVSGWVPAVAQRPEVPAFPGAEGHGALARGGRGGRIIEVSNLNDSGPGSLRAALEASGPRTVVFRVAGTILLEDTIRIKGPASGKHDGSYLTVAGQTAPGGGIVLRGPALASRAGGSTLIRIDGGAHDIVFRYLRLRNGSGLANNHGHDNFNVRWGHHIILDHVSMSWATDENLSLYIQTGSVGERIHDVTIQRSIMAEGIRGHSKGMIVGGKADFSDPRAPVEYWRSIENISIHHNLFAHNEDRNPRINSLGTVFANNVSYNWSRWIGETSRGSIVDHVNNVFKAGPMSSASRERRRFLIHDPGADPVKRDPSIFTRGNVLLPDRPDPDADNWTLYKMIGTWEPLPARFRRSTPLPASAVPVTIETAMAAYQSVLDDVGASARLDCEGRWVSNTDTIDRRILAEARSGSGPSKAYASVTAAGGYPRIEGAAPCPDGDGDGMPDAWERRNGFDPGSPLDGAGDADADGYTNVEEYLNGTPPRGTEAIVDSHGRAPTKGKGE